jgi:hypothetical protein
MRNPFDSCPDIIGSKTHKGEGGRMKVPPMSDRSEFIAYVVSLIIMPISWAFAVFAESAGIFDNAYLDHTGN